MKKLFKEFKEFINKGNVLDLAVGMIIGAAFTAIITAVVNGILKPLINLIPIGETGPQTVLRPAVVDETTNTVLVEALILDWGAVISAIITFLLTALVLFIIIKAINTAKKKAEEAKAKLEAEQAAAAEAEEEAEPEPEAEPAPTTEELLGKIIEILEKKE
jgi:large conductance mechanosensitive channel